MPLLIMKEEVRRMAMTLRTVERNRSPGVAKVVRIVGGCCASLRRLLEERTDLGEVRSAGAD